MEELMEYSPYTKELPITVDELKEEITNRNKIKKLVVVHCVGSSPILLKEIVEVCEQNNVEVRLTTDPVSEFLNSDLSNMITEMDFVIEDNFLNDSIEAYEIIKRLEQNGNRIILISDIWRPPQEQNLGLLLTYKFDKSVFKPLVSIDGIIRAYNENKQYGLTGMYLFHTFEPLDVRNKISEVNELLSNNEDYIGVDKKYILEINSKDGDKDFYTNIEEYCIPALDIAINMRDLEVNLYEIKEEINLNSFDKFLSKQARNDLLLSLKITSLKNMVRI